MSLEQLLENARRREQDIRREYDSRVTEHQAKVIQNDEIRRQLKREEDDLAKMIPKTHFEKDSEWGQALEEIRVLESLVQRGESDGTV